MGMKTCILCIKKPFFYIGSFVGFFPYSFSCSHKSNGIDYKFNFSHTKVAGCLILLIIRFLYFCEFIFSENRPHHVQFVNIIVTTLCFLYQVFSLYTSRIKLLSLKCLLQASKSKNDEILNKFQSGKLQRTSLYHILCALVQLSLGVVYLGIGYKAQLQRIIDCFDMYIFVTSQADIHMDIFVFCAIFDAFYKRIRFFNERSNWKHKKNSIGPKIISFLKFYKILFHSFQLASLYSSPLLIVSILIIIIYQVYYCTINIGSILYKSELNVSLEYGLSLCITYTLTVSSFIPVVKLESINTQVGSY